MPITVKRIATVGALAGLMHFPLAPSVRAQTLVESAHVADAQRARAAPTKTLNPFMASTFGNERRTFEEAGAIGTNSQLMSTVKGGLQIQLLPGFMMAPTAGASVSFEQGGRVSPFAEVEVNHTFHTGGYAGTGIGAWDIGGRGAAATILIHFGAALATFAPGRARLLFTFESRLFFGQLNNIDNNYQALVGMRYVFK